MFFKIFPDNPQPRLITQVVAALKKGQLIIYPTDSVYGLACSIDQLQALEQMERVKGYYTDSLRLAIVCSDLSQIAAYCRPISNPVFKLMKRNLPGPYTFILEANNQVPKLFKGKKHTVGIRVPDNGIVEAIVRELGCPLVSTSLPFFEEEPEYACDPDYIKERFEDKVAIVIDGGICGSDPSAIIDCTGDVPEIIREGPLPLREA